MSVLHTLSMIWETQRRAGWIGAGVLGSGKGGRPEEGTESQTTWEDHDSMGRYMGLSQREEKRGIATAYFVWFFE